MQIFICVFVFFFPLENNWAKYLKKKKTNIIKNFKTFSIILFLKSYSKPILETLTNICGQIYSSHCKSVKGEKTQPKFLIG